MGYPTVTNIHNWTDRLAAQIQAVMDGRKAEYTPSTASSLYVQVDGSGDPAVESALIALADTLDKSSLPENVQTWLPQILSRPAFQNFARAINTLVLSADGGSNASLRAYLNTVSAHLHPLSAELFRNVLGEGVFSSSGTPLGVSNPTYAAIFPTRVYQGADGSLATETTDAASATTGDVTLFASNSHALYLGLDRPFNTIVIALSQLADTTITPTFQYWNGSAWATLTVTDSSAGLTKNDAITFTAPTDWARSYKDSGGTALADTCPLYYVRIARTAGTVNTLPIGTMISLLPTAIAGPTSGTHAAYPQPALGLFRITAASTMTVTLPVAGVDYTRFVAPVSSEAKLTLRALTPIAQNLTVTLTYLDGAGANGSAAQSSWTAPAANGTKAMVLTNTTDSLRSAKTTSTVSTTATEGVFVLEAAVIRAPAL